MKYALLVNRKSHKSLAFEPPAKKFQKHIIDRAIEWEDMLSNGETVSLAQIAREKGITRARVTQIMNLLKLPAEVTEFLTGLQDPGEIRRYSERRLRNNKTSKVMLEDLNNQKI